MIASQEVEKNLILKTDINEAWQALKDFDRGSSDDESDFTDLL